MDKLFFVLCQAIIYVFKKVKMTVEYLKSFWSTET